VQLLTSSGGVSDLAFSIPNANDYYEEEEEEITEKNIKNNDRDI
jgi:hypothetical protein